MPEAIVVPTNSYITQVNTTTYHDNSSHGAAWVGIASAQQIRLILTAFRILERQDWQGVATGTEKWPRTGLIDEEDVAVPSGSVPVFVESAQMELALELNSNAAVQTDADTRDNIKRLRAGPASITKFRPQSGPRFPQIMHELIGRYLEGSLADLIKPFAGGTDTETGLATYGLNRGY